MVRRVQASVRIRQLPHHLVVIAVRPLQISQSHTVHASLRVVL